jgi:putative transposase
MSIEERRAAVCFLETYGVSVQRACLLVQLQRSTFLYQARPVADDGVPQEIAVLAQAQPAHQAQARASPVEAGPAAGAAGAPTPEAAGTSSSGGSCLSQPRLGLRLPGGSRCAGHVLRVFTVMDEFTREGVAIDGGPRPRRSGSLGCWRNWWRFRGRQHTCAATTGRSSWRWRCNSGSRSDRSRRATADPGCPWQNGKDERCNGTVRDEGLNLHRFASVTAAQVRLEVFRQYYNDDRPHSRLGYQTPAEFKRAWAEALAKGQDSNIPT